MVGGPRVFLKLTRILAAGQLVEDIDNYDGIHEMMSVLIASESRDNQAAEAFGNNWDSIGGAVDASQGLAGQQVLAVLFKPSAEF